MSNALVRPANDDPEQQTMARSASAARAVETALCRPVKYDARYLAAIPAEVIERDYGCGDPSAHLREGEVVLDLGSGTGKTRFIASQVVGPAGRVIGVDMRVEAPLVADGSVDVVVSNCVLNLVRPEDKRRLFGEIHRVLGRGGRAVISDIVADEDVFAAMQADPELWSGCISGAPREDRFLEAFAEAGLYGVAIVSRQTEPWRIVGGIELPPLDECPPFPCGVPSLVRDPRETRGTPTGASGSAGCEPGGSCC